MSHYVINAMKIVMAVLEYVYLSNSPSLYLYLHAAASDKNKLLLT